jgi:hypothetical protein
MPGQQFPAQRADLARCLTDPKYAAGHSGAALGKPGVGPREAPGGRSQNLATQSGKTPPMRKEAVDRATPRMTPIGFFVACPDRCIGFHPDASSRTLRIREPGPVLLLAARRLPDLPHHTRGQSRAPLGRLAFLPRANRSRST